jgi:hypothetical protein
MDKSTIVDIFNSYVSLPEVISSPQFLPVSGAVFSSKALRLQRKLDHPEFYEGAHGRSLRWLLKN